MIPLPDYTPVDGLEFSFRTANVLRALGIQTVGDIRRHDQQFLLRVPNFGRKSLLEIIEVIGCDWSDRTDGLAAISTGDLIAELARRFPVAKP